MLSAWVFARYEVDYKVFLIGANKLRAWCYFYKHRPKHENRIGTKNTVWTYTWLHIIIPTSQCSSVLKKKSWSSADDVEDHNILYVSVLSIQFFIYIVVL